MVMRKRILILVAVVVSVAGFLIGRTSARASLAEGEQGQTPVTCSIPRTNGSFKGVMTFSTSAWMVFEDSAGTIRFIDDNCSVRSKYSRQ
jgi:hypothetical protein